MYDLDRVKKMVEYQAKKKGWKTEKLYCIKRARQELRELEQSIIDFEPKEFQALEVIDVLYFLVQAAPNDESLNIAFKRKYASNWKNKKKTEDENGNIVLK